MSIMKRDKSGALVFELTPEEQAIQDLTAKVESLTASVEIMSKKLETVVDGKPKSIKSSK